METVETGMVIDRRSWGVSIRALHVDGGVNIPQFGDSGKRAWVKWFAILGDSTPDQARAFAQRIIAVADAVEAELKGGK